MDGTISIQNQTLIRNSFYKLMPISDTFVHLFYERLFEIKPEVKALFKTSIADQGPKLIYMLGLLIRDIDRLESMTPMLSQLSKRHVAYGVQSNDYDAVGEALLWAIEQVLKEKFTPEMREAWASMYAVLAQICIRGGYEGEQAV